MPEREYLPHSSPPSPASPPPTQFRLLYNPLLSFTSQPSLLDLARCRPCPRIQKILFIYSKSYWLKLVQMNLISLGFHQQSQLSQQISKAVLNLQRVKKHTVIRRVISTAYLYSFYLGKNHKGSYYSICSMLGSKKVNKLIR